MPVATARRALLGTGTYARYLFGVLVRLGLAMGLGLVQENCQARLATMNTWTRS
jgi:hypothetical protein